MTTTAPSARLAIRVSADLHARLQRAAELQGLTMTDFVTSTLQDAAERAIEQFEVIRLSPADQEHFAHALLAPPTPTPALKRAFANRERLLQTE